MYVAIKFSPSTYLLGMGGPRHLVDEEEEECLVEGSVWRCRDPCPDQKPPGAEVEK